jgi:hypothetical protein
MKLLLTLATLLSLTSCVTQIPTRNGTQVIGLEWIWDCPDSPLCPTWLAR